MEILISKLELNLATHVLTWAFGNFQKTFPTPISGVPELLFDEGFRAYTSFCKQVMSYATTDDGTCGSNIIPFDDINPGNRGLSGADKQGHSYYNEFFTKSPNQRRNLV